MVMNVYENKLNNNNQYQNYQIWQRNILSLHVGNTNSIYPFAQIIIPMLTWLTNYQK